jgi:hypothetical protein
LSADRLIEYLWQVKQGCWCETSKYGHMPVMERLSSALCSGC